MKIMRAGWRMAYITEGSGRACVFCSVARSRADRANLVVLRGERAFVMMNRYPYSTGHLMVAPYRHVARLSGLDTGEASEIINQVRLCESLLAAALSPQGFNVGVNIGRCAGAGCPGHVHVHVVPRWEGDTNFMPVVCETKVLPETLSDTYRKIVRAGRALAWKIPGAAGTSCPTSKPGGGPSKRPGRTRGQARGLRRRSP